MSFWPDAAGTRGADERVAAAARPLPMPLPDERDATEHRATTEQERPAARRRRHQVG